MILFVQFYIVLVFSIHTNFASLFVIMKSSSWPPINICTNAPSSSINDVVQNEEHELDIEDKVNYYTEEYENNHMDEDDGTNALIEELFAGPDGMTTILMIILMYLY